MARNREPLKSLFYYRLFKWSVVAPMLHFYFRGHTYGLEKIPNEGPVVIVSNHASDFDPPFVGACMRRPVAFMAKEELFDVPFLGKAILLYGAYPVKRGEGDRAAIRKALHYLEEGWATGVFLDGTRTPDGIIEDPKLGAALIAAKAKAPILPVSVWGTHLIMQPGSSFPCSVPVTLRVGDLMPYPSSMKKEDLEATTNQCAEILNAMHALGR